MMRALLLVFVLTACGQQAPQPTSAAQTQAPATAVLDLSGPLIAVGDEFRLDALPDQNTVVLVYPAYDQTVSAPYAAPQTTPTGAVLQSGDITLTLTPGSCTHQGATYPLRASVTITNGRPADGCALVRWDRHLLELMPQIDACIAKSPETRWITFAGDTGEAIVTVRMQGDGRSVDCTIPNHGADPQLAQITPRRENLRIAVENEAVFVRGPGENPGGECYAAPEVRGGNGELLGWMMDPQGC